MEITRLDRFTAPHACIAQLRPVGPADGDTGDGRAEGDDVENLPGWSGRITG